MVAVLAALCDSSHAQSSFIEFNGLRVPQSVLTVVSIDLENVPFEAALAEISRKGSFFLSSTGVAFRLIWR